MARFGKNKFYARKRSILRRFIFHTLGDDFIGATIRFFHFKRALRNVHFRLALDAGCGTGDFAFYIAERYYQSKVDAYDISENSISEDDRVKKVMGINNINFYRRDILRMKDKLKYDFIFSMVSILYFTDRQNKIILKNIYNALEEGGFFYLDLPTVTFNNFHIIPKRYYNKWSRHTFDQLPGHLYSSEKLKSILKSLGFEVIYLRNSFGYAGMLAWEIDAIIKEHNLDRLKIILLPALKTLAWLDYLLKNKNGSCVCILCKKPSLQNLRVP